MSRLVPLDLVETKADGIRLRCTVAEFGRLEAAEETQLVDDLTGGLGLGGRSLRWVSPLRGRPSSRMLFPRVRQTSIAANPSTRSTVRSGGWRASGRSGRPPGDPRAAQEGHLWGRKEVAIPVSAVTKVENGIWLNLTKKQVEDLPPTD